MATLGALNCTSLVGNTGVQPCFLDFKFIQGAILAPKGFQFDVTTLQTTLAAGLYNASKSARLFPVYDFEAPKDGSEAKVIQTMANGQKHVVREGFNQWGFQYVAGGLSLHKNLRTFNGSNWDFFFIDNDSQGQKIFGITGSTATKLKAIPSDGGYFWAEPWKMNDGSKIAEYMIEFVFKSALVNDQIAFAQATFDFPTTLPGLDDAIIGASATVNGTSKNFNVTVTNPLGVDLGAVYATVLNSNSLWVGTGVGGAALTISSVTWVPSTTVGVPGYFTIVVGATNYPTPTAPITLNLTVPATLVAAGAYLESTGVLSIASN